MRVWSRMKERLRDESGAIADIFAHAAGMIMWVIIMSTGLFAIIYGIRYIEMTHIGDFVINDVSANGCYTTQTNQAVINDLSLYGFAPQSTTLQINNNFTTGVPAFGSEFQVQIDSKLYVDIIGFKITLNVVYSNQGVEQVTPTQSGGSPSGIACTAPNL